MEMLKNDDEIVIVNKSGHQQIETLANVINTTKMGHDYIVGELVEAGFTTVESVVKISEEEMARRCSDIREYVPSIHRYAMRLRELGIF